MNKPMTRENQGVSLTADAVVLTGQLPDTQVLLIKRGWPPYEGMWALPGGHVEEGERFRDAALRELAEETGLRGALDPVLVGVYDDPGRDPRGRVVSVAYAIRVPSVVAGVGAGDDAVDVTWVPVRRFLPDLGGSDRLAFDHTVILRHALVMFP